MKNLQKDFDEIIQRSLSHIEENPEDFKAIEDLQGFLDDVKEVLTSALEKAGKT